MPEIVEALVSLCQIYSAQLKKEKNSEYQGWDNVEDALKEALKKIDW